jgi:hypothetical protein
MRARCDDDTLRTQATAALDLDFTRGHAARMAGDAMLGRPCIDSFGDEADESITLGPHAGEHCCRVDPRWACDDAEVV